MFLTFDAPPPASYQDYVISIGKTKKYDGGKPIVHEMGRLATLDYSGTV